MEYKDIHPIDETIEPFKRKSRLHYGFHGYFTTQPFNVVQAYINHFTKEGDLVVDPYVGSGVTAVESLRLGRKSFVTDLNPFSIFLTKAKCSYVNLDVLNKFFSHVLSEIKDEYEEINNLNEDETNNLEVPYWYPENVKLPSNADREYLHEIFTKKQLYQLAFIKHKIDELEPSNEKDILLILFCGTVSRANIAYSLPDDGRSIFAGDFTIFHTGRYRVPKKIVKVPVLPVFVRRFKALVQAKNESNLFITKEIQKKNFNASVCSATNLKNCIADKSVDYVYTDPPYGGHIAYLDLSIVYNAWLKLKVTKKDQNNEAIEGGELKQSREKYFSLLNESFAEISRILKPDRWLSLVFQHKEPAIWTNIVEMAKNNGLEFKNTVVQHTKLPSWHKIDVPQSVMSCQMILNFSCKEKVSFIKPTSNVRLEELILNVAEREIIKRTGANLEEIINALVPELFLNNFTDKASQTKTDYIMGLLAQEFDYYESTLTYNIKEEKLKTIGSYIPVNEKVSMYLNSYLKRVGKAKFDDILSAILPLLINGKTPSSQEIIEELEKIADYEGEYWVFKSGIVQKSLKFEMDNEGQNNLNQITNSTEHNKTIYMLAKLAETYNLLPKIGDQEQRNDSYLKQINKIPKLHFAEIEKKQNSYVNNIDCLWFTENSRKPIFAFEVEHSTIIDTAFERFLSLLKVAPDVGHKQRLIIVISRKNKKQFETKIRESSYIGAPHYINNKVRFIFEEALKKNFRELLKEKHFTKFEGLLSTPELG